VLVLAITSAAVAATFVPAGGRGSVRVPGGAGGRGPGPGHRSRQPRPHLRGPPQPGGDARAGRQQALPLVLRPGLHHRPVRRRDSRGRSHLGPVRNQARSIARLGATVPAPGVSAGRVLAAEAIVTFVLVLVVVAVATVSRVPRGIAAMTIGAALAVATVIAGPVSGAGVNPARAIAPMILAGQFSDWWAYLAAPVAGGVVAIALYDRFLRVGSTPA